MNAEGLPADPGTETTGADAGKIERDSRGTDVEARKMDADARRMECYGRRTDGVNGKMGLTPGKTDADFERMDSGER